MKTAWYKFNQNYANETWDINDSLGHDVLIEVPICIHRHVETNVAEDIAKSIGIYFYGSCDGIDDPRYGDRWYTCPDRLNDGAESYVLGLATGKLSNYFAGDSVRIIVAHHYDGTVQRWELNPFESGATHRGITISVTDPSGNTKTEELQVELVKK